MDGAVSSGRRAAREIVHALGGAGAGGAAWRKRAVSGAK